jgi:hypothetical protein
MTKDVTSAGAAKVAAGWFKKSEGKVAKNDVDGILSLFNEDAWSLVARPACDYLRPALVLRPGAHPQVPT